MKRIFLVSLPFIVLGCGKKAPETPVSISPAKAQGIWADQNSIQPYRTTGKISSKDCQSSSAFGMDAVGIYQFEASGEVDEYDPSKAHTDSDKLLVYRNGQLEYAQDQKGFKSSITLLKTLQKGLRFHSETQDLSTGKTTYSDTNLVKISDAEAKDILAQEQACIQKPISGRITSVPVGTGHLTITGGITRDETYSSAKDSEVSCGKFTNTDQPSVANLSIASYINKSAGIDKEKSDGLAIFMLLAQKRDGSSQTVSLPAQSLKDSPSLSLSFADETDAAYSGSCVVQLNEVSHVLEAKVHCDSVTRKDDKTGASQQGTLDATYACYNAFGDGSSNP